jgi:polyhydroxyalkanoate synthase
LWTGWLNDKGNGKQVAARAINEGIEPAPGRYAMMP